MHLACVAGRRRGGKGSKNEAGVSRARFFPFPPPLRTPATQAIMHLAIQVLGLASLQACH